MVSTIRKNIKTVSWGNAEVCRNLLFIIEKARKAAEVIIVGAGYWGTELLTHLQENDDISIKCFFDNDGGKIGGMINNV